MSKLALDTNSKPIQVMRPSTTQDETVTGSSAQCSAFGHPCRVVRLVATAAINYEVGTNPTATASTVYLPAGVVEYVHVNDDDIIAHIGSGNLYITEMY